MPRTQTPRTRTVVVWYCLRHRAEQLQTRRVLPILPVEKMRSLHGPGGPSARRPLGFADSRYARLLFVPRRAPGPIPGLSLEGAAKQVAAHGLAPSSPFALANHQHSTCHGASAQQEGNQRPSQI
ncbi:hypothetical protein CI238_10668 [Colletotrichum incanum]|uniref:Uncharacterized protein n=1 Tax=Colletotrichum incanum TaxID=1573173 RepID=A0A167AX12_COLIC|nr:hypothetical protein CI238_10668 [Colletotrichum incanum]